MLRSPLSSPLRSPLSSPLAARRGGGAPAFDPATLFASGEQGGWYDPSDLSTLFQDNAGASVVTAAGQAVGLFFDKSKNLDLGSDLTSNPATWSGSANWSVNTATRTATVTNSTNSGDVLNAGTISGSLGQVYEVLFEVTSISGGGITIANSRAAGVALYSSAGTYKHFFNITLVGAGAIQIRPSQPGVIGALRVISIRLISGNHASQANTSLRPAYRVAQPRIDYDGVDDVLNINFESSLGSSCTIARSIPGTGASILTGQTIGTSYADNADHCGLIIINRGLTSEETTNVTAWLNNKAGI
jgi:hypothetical protein